jgi:transposase
VVRDLSCGLLHIYLELEIRRVACVQCGGVKRERLDWLADNPFYTKRFAYYVGRRCRDSTIKAIAEELDLDWKTVKELDKQYMREQLRRVGRPAPLVIGIDEVSIRKGHTYRIVVSDCTRSQDSRGWARVWAHSEFERRQTGKREQRDWGTPSGRVGNQRRGRLTEVDPKCWTTELRI